MSKQRIFELIRKEEAALFVGAGMSLYAGYPSGAKLAEILFNNLTSDLQEQVDFTTNLPKLAEDIYYLKGGNKNYLIENLKNEFQKEPISTGTHQLLAKIPQIKTIITTNYDTLFETTNKSIEVIRKSSDCATTNSKKQCLFKIHGDLSDTSNIILTNSDYNNYFIKDSEKSIFWNTVKTKLVENHIIFIGYALEDSNVLTTIGKILDELGDHRKEMFFVAPSIQPAKLKFLQQKGIEFIQAKAEDLFKEIDEDLKLNYLPGLNKGIGTADTAFNFAKVNNINIGLSKDKDFYIVDKISSLDGIEKNEVKFKIEGEEKSTKKIINSLRGKDFDDVHLSGEIIKEYNHFFNGIRIKNQENIKSLHIKKVPNIFGLFNFVFEDGFEIENYYLEIFISNPSQNQVKMKIKANDFDVLISIDLSKIDKSSKFHVEIVPSNTIKSIRSGINFYSILSRITSNNKFKMFKENKLFFNYNEKIIFDDDPFDATFLLDYFNSLRKIEKYFEVQFTNISLDDANEKKLKHISAYIDKIVLQEKFNGMTFKNKNKKEFNFLIEEGHKDKVLVMSDKQISIYNLHGIDFKIGYLHKYIQDAYIENLEDLKNNRTKEFSMKSKSNTVYFQFTDNKTMITQQ
ncbi:SIR2 family protein [Flavobacterium sp.]|uniref:SIR2 family protein n=1 Tax=Flavobacterium sp. TaxID=239 RepID=UPI0035B28269